MALLKKKTPKIKMSAVTQVNSWKLVRRVINSGAGKTNVYRAICPACNIEKGVTLARMEAQSLCDVCIRKITVAWKKLSKSMQRRIRTKYLEHLAISKKVGSQPEPLVRFIQDYTQHPALLDDESIVYRDEPKSASPLTWLIGAVS